jgi:hypothetical protein
LKAVRLLILLLDILIVQLQLLKKYQYPYSSQTNISNPLNFSIFFFHFFFSSMTEPSKKRLKPDLNYSTPTSTPSYSQRRSKEMVMLAPNGGFGPDGFRTPLPFPNTPNSIAGGTPTLGNQPFTGPVVPVRMF